jgi:hypothetical protein
VAVTGSGVRLSPDEDHCSIFVVGTVISLQPTRRRKAMVSQSKISETTLITASCCSSSSQDDEALMTKIHEEEDQNKHDETQRLSSDSNTSHDAQQSPRHNASVSLQQNSTDSLATLEEVSKCSECDNSVEVDELEDDDASLRNNYFENFRVAEIIRYLPTAVCLFDMEGHTTYQNPAAYLPEDDDCANTGNIDGLVGYQIQIGESREEKEYRIEERTKLGFNSVRDIESDDRT